MLSATVIKELIAELRAKQARRETVEKEKIQLTEEASQLDQQIGSIRVLLASSTQGLPNAGTSTTQEPPKGHDEAGTEAPGLRDAIRIALGESPFGLRPFQVTLRLKEMGFRPGGKAELGTRVSNELWRMAKNGLIARSRGKYSLKEKIADIKIVS